MGVKIWRTKAEDTPIGYHSEGGHWLNYKDHMPNKQKKGKKLCDWMMAD
jgi:hypothetical protein